MKKTESGQLCKPSAQRNMDASVESAERRLKVKTDSSVERATQGKKIRITKSIKSMMNAARLAGENSSCRRRKVGCVAVAIEDIEKSGGVQAHGFNCSSWVTSENCIECRRDTVESGEYLEKCPAVHAEVVAAVFAAKVDVPSYTHRDRLLVTSSMVPCQNCMKVLILTDFRRIIVDIPKRYDDLSIELAEKAGIEIYSFDDGRRIV